MKFWSKKLLVKHALIILFTTSKTSYLQCSWCVFRLNEDWAAKIMQKHHKSIINVVMHKSFWSHTIALCLEQIKIYVVFTDNIFHNQCEWITESFENGIRSISQSDPWMNHLDFSINCFTKKLTLTMDSVNNELFILSMNINFNLFHTKRKKKNLGNEMLFFIIDHFYGAILL